MFKSTLILLSILFIASCATEPPKGKTAAESLYKESLELVESGRLILANERLNQLKSQHPYSYYATPAELLQADILFKQENYVEAAAAYMLFRDFHPRNKKIDYVVWRIAESYYNQIPDTYDRDLSSGREAVKYYYEVVQKYPNFKDMSLVKEKITSIQKMLEQKEAYIADFYYRTEVFQAARIRYQMILSERKNFVATDELRNLAMIRISDSSRLAGNFDQCLDDYSLYINMIEDKSKDELNKVKEKCQQKDNG